MQFSLFPQDDDRFTFQVQDETNLPILNSPVFFNRESCIASIRGFIDQIRNPEAVDIVEEKGTFAFVLKDEAGEAWMKSLSFEEKGNLQVVLKLLQEKASGNTSFEVNMRRQKDQSLPSLPKEINYEELYDFGLVSRSKKLGFHTLQSKKNKKYYFLFNNDQGTPILYSRSFSTPAQRDKRIRAIIKQADKRHKYEVLQNEGGTFFIIKGRNGKEIARSATFPDEGSAELALQLLQEKAASFSQKFPEPPKAPKKEVNQYRLGQASTSGLTGFDPFESEDKLHYFHFNDVEAKPLLFSEGYTSTRSRNNGIKSLIRNAGLQNRYQVKEDEAKPYFILRAGNRQEIARSRAFESKEELDKAVDWLRIQIPRYAAEYNVSLDTDFLDENFLIEVGRGDEEDEILLPVDPVVQETTESKPSREPVETVENPSSRQAQPKKKSSNPSEFSLLWERVWPWLLLALALFLLYLLLKNCATGTGLNPDSLNPNKNESVIAAEPLEEFVPSENLTTSVSSENKSLSDELSPEEKEELSKIDSKTTSLAPDNRGSSRVNFPVGSMLAKMEAFLAGADTGKSPTYIMDHARFPYNSPKLNKEAEKELDELANLLAKHPEAKVHILGHLDLNEDDYYSGPFAEEFMTLSDIRARCIYRKLLERGITESRLSFKGLANHQPLAKETNSINRRLELVLEK